MQLIEKYWSQYDFFKDSHLLNELESRGFDQEFDMPCYLYREDGRKIWEAYGNFSRNFIDATYLSDSEVKEDKGLRLWTKEMRQKACVPGFPDHFQDKETLALTLQTLGCISVQHAAVNFPQYDVSIYEAIVAPGVVQYAVCILFSQLILSSPLHSVLYIFSQQTIGDPEWHGAVSEGQWGQARLDL
jgi:hypothetical protein